MGKSLSKLAHFVKYLLGFENCIFLSKLGDFYIQPVLLRLPFYSRLSVNCCGSPSHSHVTPNLLAELAAGCLHSNRLKILKDFPQEPILNKSTLPLLSVSTFAYPKQKKLDRIQKTFVFWKQKSSTRSNARFHFFQSSKVR